jgi:hypothetical protein
MSSRQRAPQPLSSPNYSKAAPASTRSQRPGSRTSRAGAAAPESAGLVASGDLGSPKVRLEPRSPELHSRIAELAYRFYEERGRQSGFELDDRLAAERVVLSDRDSQAE